MKIMVIISSLQRGGAERVASLLSMEWSNTHDVSFIVFDRSNKAFNNGGNLFSLNIPSEKTLTRKLFNVPRRTLALFFKMREVRPDFVVSFMESSNIPSIFAAFLCGMLSRLTISVRTFPSYLPWYVRIAMRISYRYPNRIVAVSPPVADFLATELKCQKNRVDFIPNPLAHAEMQRKSMEALSGLAIPSRQFILSAGRLDPIKGFDLLIRAFSQIADRERVDLFILGEGPERDKLEHLVRELGLSERVFFSGSVDNPWSWMKSCSIYVLSSRNEGWPNALAEAMALGCVVVSFSCDSGPEEMIEHGSTGYLVPRENTSALAEQLLEVLENPDVAKSCGRKAKAWADGYALGPIAEKWLRR